MRRLFFFNGANPTLYLSDVKLYPVAYETMPTGEMMARGLPIMKPGTWNGTPYTLEDLKLMATCFNAIKASTAWEPALRPRHKFDENGRPENQDAREVLGWWTQLYVDEADETLKGDAQVLNYDTLMAMQNTQLRWLSAEIVSNYEIDTETYPLVFVGAAFVDDPGVKGLPWTLVVNAKQFSFAPSAGAVPEGGNSMLDQLKKMMALIAKVFQGTATAEEVNQLQAEVNAAGAVVVPAADAPAGAAPAPAAAVAGQMAAHPTDPRVVQLEREAQDNRARIAQLEAQSRSDQATALVDQLVAAGSLPPASRQAAYLVALQLMEKGGNVKMLTQQGETTTETETPVVEVFRSMFAPIAAVQAGNKPIVWMGSEDPAAQPEMKAEDLDALADSVGGVAAGS